MTKEQKECPGCSRPWNGDPIFCSICQAHGVGGQEPGLAGLVASFKPGTELASKTMNPCAKCGHMIPRIFHFCKECMHWMSWNEVTGVFGQV